MRQRHWLELLKDYDTNIQYHPGKANIVADALSWKSGMIAGIKVEEEIIRDLERLDIELYVRGQHGYWASLRVEPDLISQIKEAQKEDSKIWTIVENLDKKVEFRLDDDNVLWQDTRLVVPNDASLREALLTEAHSSPFFVHPGSTKMYHDFKQHFWWSDMKRDPLDIPVWKWDEISMDFVTGLPWTQRRHDAIRVVVDRLTKSAHFFLSARITLLVGNWDDYICLVEFAYNNSWHASIKCAPFEMLYGRKCRAPICWDQVGERVIKGPEMIEVTNKKDVVSKEKLKEARTRQKSYADKHRRSLEFQPGDHVFLKVSPAHRVRCFGIKGKLSPHFIEPFEILDRVGEVSYRLALPPQLSHVHNVFHVSLLRGYKYHPLYVISYLLDQICADLSYVEEPEAILDRQDRVMRKKTIPFVKILWRNHPKFGVNWGVTFIVNNNKISQKSELTNWNEDISCDSVRCADCTHSRGIRDMQWKIVPSMQNKIYLNWRVRFLDWRRWWDLDGVFRVIWVVYVSSTHSSSSGLMDLGGLGTVGPSVTSLMRVVMALSSPFELATVLSGRVPDPEVEAVFICKRLAIMFLISLVWLDKEV
nr:retrotransposon protein, putative, Ty3-gypsy subclass [Tanacetum cinerariifolium]